MAETAARTQRPARSTPLDDATRRIDLKQEIAAGIAFARRHNPNRGEPSVDYIADCVLMFLERGDASR
jgi:hypothetical protein